MDSSMLEEVLRIGFNEDVKLDGRTLHVQTEVMHRGKLMIRTTVVEKGMVKLSEKTVAELEGRQPDEIRAVAEERHRATVGKVRGGEVG